MKRITGTNEFPVIAAARILESFLLALWIGMMTGFAFIFAPVAFHFVRDLHEFAAVTGTVIARLTIFGFIAAGTAIIVSFAGPQSRAVTIRRLCLVAAIVLLAVARYAVAPQMDAAMARMSGNIAAYAESSPERAAYRATHRTYSNVYGGALILGYAAFLLGLGRSFARPAAHARKGEIGFND